MPYPTVGWWGYARDNTWEIRVAKMSDWRFELCIMVHELVEMAWCHMQGINVKDVDAFDIEYEENRKEGDISEPGDNPRAPYHFGHQVATIVERLVLLALGGSWQVYTLEIESL